MADRMADGSGVCTNSLSKTMYSRAFKDSSLQMMCLCWRLLRNCMLSRTSLHDRRGRVPRSHGAPRPLPPVSGQTDRFTHRCSEHIQKQAVSTSENARDMQRIAWLECAGDIGPHPSGAGRSGHRGLGDGMPGVRILPAGSRRAAISRQKRACQILFPVSVPGDAVLGRIAVC